MLPLHHDAALVCDGGLLGDSDGHGSGCWSGSDGRDGLRCRDLLLGVGYGSALDPDAARARFEVRCDIPSELVCGLPQTFTAGVSAKRDIADPPALSLARLGLHLDLVEDLPSSYKLYIDGDVRGSGCEAHRYAAVHLGHMGHDDGRAWLVGADPADAVDVPLQALGEGGGDALLVRVPAGVRVPIATRDEGVLGLPVDDEVGEAHWRDSERSWLGKGVGRRLPDHDVVRPASGREEREETGA